MDIFEIVESFSLEGRWYLRAPRVSGGIEVHNWRNQSEPWRDEIEGWHFTSGRRFDASSPLVLAIYEGNLPLDFTFGSMGMPVVKERVAEALRPLCGEAVQWIPAIVPGFEEKFEIANVLGMVEALDLDRSEYTRRRCEVGLNKVGSISGVSRVVLNSECLNSVSTFRLKEWLPPLFITSAVKNVLQELSVTGITFRTIEVT